jgi:DNA-binding MarR family transcriptional regulator
MSTSESFESVFHEWIDVFMHRSMKGFIEYAREAGLSMSMLGALFHLHKMGSSGVTDLGGHLGVTSAGASQMLDRLVQQGLIQRSEDPDDRRVKQIVLTEQGCQVLKDGIRARHEWLQNLSKILSPQEKDQISSALTLMIEKSNQE